MEDVKKRDKGDALYREMKINLAEKKRSNLRASTINNDEHARLLQ